MMQADMAQKVSPTQEKGTAASKSTKSLSSRCDQLTKQLHKKEQIK